MVGVYDAEFIDTVGLFINILKYWVFAINTEVCHCQIPITHVIAAIVHVCTSLLARSVLPEHLSTKAKITKVKLVIKRTFGTKTTDSAIDVDFMHSLLVAEMVEVARIASAYEYLDQLAELTLLQPCANTTGVVSNARWLQCAIWQLAAMLGHSEWTENVVFD